ncbi:Protein of unknown function [Pyronema omphalodes CBS 100304]|uniref:Uncharacterized protein n=1 Tax=Pyronema omphalodes (strain CBS 100304) TaxID=1076935 RepID=U4L0E6_PYROM|nr:Protein of unknown function [Pyronema omphalodes CBS 100304]
MATGSAGNSISNDDFEQASSPVANVSYTPPSTYESTDEDELELPDAPARRMIDLSNWNVTVEFVPKTAPGECKQVTFEFEGGTLRTFEYTKISFSELWDKIAVVSAWIEDDSFNLTMGESWDILKCENKSLIVVVVHNPSDYLWYDSPAEETESDQGLASRLRRAVEYLKMEAGKKNLTYSEVEEETIYDRYKVFSDDEGGYSDDEGGYSEGCFIPEVKEDDKTLLTENLNSIYKREGREKLIDMWSKGEGNSEARGTKKHRSMTGKPDYRVQQQQRR